MFSLEAQAFRKYHTTSHDSKWSNLTQMVLSSSKAHLPPTAYLPYLYSPSTRKNKPSLNNKPPTNKGTPLLPPPKSLPQAENPSNLLHQNKQSTPFPRPKRTPSRILRTPNLPPPHPPPKPPIHTLNRLNPQPQLRLTPPTPSPLTTTTTTPPQLPNNSIHTPPRKSLSPPPLPPPSQS